VYNPSGEHGEARKFWALLLNKGKAQQYSDVELCVREAQRSKSQ
jgi:hypothetical protein